MLDIYSIFIKIERKFKENFIDNKGLNPSRFLI